MEDHRLDLTCPISLELLDDPISTPCCGQALSRASLQKHIARENCCPLCRADFRTDYPSFNVDKAARNRTIAGLVEAQRERDANEPERAAKATVAAASVAASLVGASDAGPQYRCSLVPCQTRGGARLPVGRLKVDVEWPSFEGDVCLFMPVIDKSGSMGGQPFAQVKTALMHMLHQTLANRSVFTCIIPYDSNAEIIKVPRDGGSDTERWHQVQARINSMYAGGGTSFRNAFARVKEVLFGDTSGGKVRAQEFEPGTAEFEAQRQLGRKGLLVQGAPAFVKSVVIVFMTDGMDNSRNSKQALVEELRNALSAWDKKVVVHTIGFSQSHDFAFLDALRKVGRTEGTYRYADPSDGPDTLCSKLSELTDAIVANTCLSVRLESIPFPLWSRAAGPEQVAIDTSVSMRDGCGSWKAFVQLCGSHEQVSEVAGKELQLSVPSGQADGGRLHDAAAILLPAQGAAQGAVADDAMHAEVLAEWQKVLVDEVVQELAGLASGHGGKASTRPLTARLHLGFLLQRVKALEVHVKWQEDAPLAERLGFCSSQLTAMLSGSAVNLARLADAQHTVTAAAEARSPRANAGPVNPEAAAVVPNRAGAPAERGLPPRCCSDGHGRVFGGREGFTALHHAVLQGTVDVIREQLQSDNGDFVGDSDGDTALAMAAAIGRCNAAKALLSSQSCCAKCLTRANNHGVTPLMYAALRGHWKMVELLLHAGAGACMKPSAAEWLIDSALRRGFYNSAARLVAAGLGSATLDVLRGRVPAATLEWVMQQHAEADLRDNATDAGLSRERGQLYLRQAVENGMLDLVRKLLEDGVRPAASDLGELLLLNGGQQIGAQIAGELLNAAAADDAGLLGEQIHAAAAQGWAQLLELFLRHSASACDWQNPRGQTALLAACQARHLDCVVALLNAGASPALSDHAGTSPLMASCSRNHCAAVGALLAAGAPVFGSAGEETPAVMFCCTIGRPEILDMQLKHAVRSKGQGNVQSELRRLGALHMAAEHDQTACIKVLLGHGADVESLTGDSHGAPRSGALHVAAFHGRVGAASVLLEGGAAVDARDGRGRTALHIAVQHGGVLVVRLLRSSGADMHAKDDSGNVPTSYCLRAEGDAAAALRAELLDPALEFLLAASRTHDEEACDTLRFAGLPGLLSVRQCVDVHSGDQWTPLLEAVTSGNFAFAGALVKAGADARRVDRQGLSPLFWAQVLHGHDSAAALVAQELEPAQSLIEVQCKDGALRVSSDAHDWMQEHFPAVAAASVPCATLALTLKAQGFGGDAAAADSQASSQEALLTAHEADALARLEAAKRRDVRDAMILQMRFDKAHLDDGLADAARPDQHTCRLRAMMQCSPKARLLAGDDMDPGVTAATLKAGAGASVVDLLQTLAEDSGTISQASLARARHAAVSVAASGSPAHAAALGLQQLFLLHLLQEEKLLLERVNACLAGKGGSEAWEPLAACALQALRALPSLEPHGLVYSTVPGAELDVGAMLDWPGFLVVTDDASALSAQAARQAQEPRMQLCIKAQSVRLFSGVFSDDSFGVLLPFTRLRVTSVSGAPSARPVRVELEEIDVAQASDA